MIARGLMGSSLFAISCLIASGQTPSGASPIYDNGGLAQIPGTGTARGIVRLDNTKNWPTGRLLNISQDAECSRISGGITSDEVVLGTNGTLANVIVYISDGPSQQDLDSPTEAVKIEQQGCMFRPHVLAMQANQKLLVVNDDPVTMNIHPLPVKNPEWNKSAPPGAGPMAATFPNEEIAIPVRSNIRPWMKSYIAVFRHPFYAVTKMDGSFDISNLPPGTYTLQAWHEKFGTLTKTITIGKGETKQVDLVFAAAQARADVQSSDAQNSEGDTADSPDTQSNPSTLQTILQGITGVTAGANGNNGSTAPAGQTNGGPAECLKHLGENCYDYFGRDPSALPLQSCILVADPHNSNGCLCYDKAKGQYCERVN